MSEFVKAALAVLAELWAAYRARKARRKADQAQAKAERRESRAQGYGGGLMPPPPPRPTYRPTGHHRPAVTVVVNVSNADLERIANEVAEKIKAMLEGGKDA